MGVLLWRYQPTRGGVGNADLPSGAWDISARLRLGGTRSAVQPAVQSPEELVWNPIVDARLFRSTERGLFRGLFFAVVRRKDRWLWPTAALGPDAQPGDHWWDLVAGDIGADGADLPK